MFKSGIVSRSKTSSEDHAHSKHKLGSYHTCGPLEELPNPARSDSDISAHRIITPDDKFMGTLYMGCIQPYSMNGCALLYDLCSVPAGA